MNKNLITTGTVATNRKARFNYAILETFEAGIVLSGGEVKSLRGGHASISESYATKENGRLMLINAHILEYAATKGGFAPHEAARPRELLLHKKELKKIFAHVDRKGQTIVPLEIYFNNRGIAKVRLGLAVGKTHSDKRADIKKRDWNIEKRRVLAHFNNGKKI
ncbi:MAG: SsrA-binding protein SmpB [Lactobacillales bacterium]|jgi:SsrA-binding protein|nr:SsrA-binding protein SmpB [Lactobacillales bacterium]